ncbi:lipopolysaccharide cholinephosphotransferase [Enterococcus sp. AZ194]|uniref:LicD family protein n=1 Tax=Enterococcus sp. AZ194 TaxID=2774629 RepID=UPI003F284EA1
MVNGLRKVQLAELAIIDEIVRICNENGITYYISGGTYLGAVRHNGFIPWDDDADIAMPRKQFDRFLEIAQKELQANFELKDYRFDLGYPYYVPKVVDNSVLLLDRSTVDEKIIPAWVDIFPLDGLPSNAIRAYFHKKILLFKRYMYNMSSFNQIVKVNKKNRPLLEKIFVWIGKNTNLFNKLNSKKIMDSITRSLKRFPEDKSDTYMNFMGSYKFKSILNKKNIYGDGADYSFEGRYFNGPKNYHEYLTQIYGDYMQIPDESEQNKHETLVIKEEVTSSEQN